MKLLPSPKTIKIEGLDLSARVMSLEDGSIVPSPIGSNLRLIKDKVNELVNAVNELSELAHKNAEISAVTTVPAEK